MKTEEIKKLIEEYNVSMLDEEDLIDLKSTLLDKVEEIESFLYK